MSSTEIEPKDEALPAEYLEGLDTGLEDFDSTDMVMPRLNIDHNEAVFVDNLTGQKFDKMRVVLLGLVKQRILWAEEVGDGEGPMCKAYTFDTGHPNLKTFPWKASGFEQPDGDGDITLPCESCALKEWDSHPQRKTPWCSEQYTMPLLMQMGDDDDAPFAAPAILTLQRSGIKPARSYVTGFARASTPLFTAITQMELAANKKGSVNFAVPKFAKDGVTDKDEWRDYSSHYRSIREFLTTPPSPDKDDSGAATASDNKSEAGSGDDDLPF